MKKITISLPESKDEAKVAAKQAADSTKMGLIKAQAGFASFLHSASDKLAPKSEIKSEISE
jgi:hypothetical protein